LGQKIKWGEYIWSEYGQGRDRKVLIDNGTDFNIGTKNPDGNIVRTLITETVLGKITEIFLRKKGPTKIETRYKNFENGV
jgi:hypothetical protein